MGGKSEKHEITVGMKGEFSLTVSDEDTAKSLGSGSLAVFATPAMMPPWKPRPATPLGLTGGEPPWERRLTSAMFRQRRWE